MTEWHALKVTDLKEELKSRGIPLTGLKLKQQLVDKLVEVESQSTNNNTPETQNGHPHGDSSGQVEKDLDGGNTVEERDENVVAVDQKSLDTEGTTTEAPPALAAEEDHAAKADSGSPTPVEVKDDDAADEVLRDDPFLPEVTGDENMQDQEGTDNHPGPAATPGSEKSTEVAEDVDHKTTESSSWRRRTSKSDFETTTSTRVPTPDILDDQRKRKRRSASPPLDTQEMNRKKAKVDNETPPDDEAELAALKSIQSATDRAEIARQPNNNPEEPPLQPMEASTDVAAMRAAKEVGSLPSAPELDSSGATVDKPATPPESPLNDMMPSIHPATQSLYMRNFKRPLHIPTLRSHVSSLARSSGSHSEDDPVKLFFLDTIRTHAFISFQSVTAATRVRNAMHDTRFPDEPMREPLWIDFIPDEKVQTWIDEESGAGKGGFGGSRMGRKFEVRYGKTSDGVTASLHDGASEAGRSAPSTQRTARPEQNISNSIASGVHPDRANLVAHKVSRPPPQRDAGKGFKALDELFGSTQTKPKIYYKLPEQSIIDARLEMMNGLRLEHGDMGKSGDEGMKRYTFEEYKGEQEWVDKGPEFGFGRKGQERLTGFRGRGGHRGSKRGGDSWRGR